MTEQQKELNRRKMHQLLDLVLDINGFEKRQKEITGDKPTMFFEINGHVAGCQVYAHTTGYEADEPSDLGSNFYFDKPMETDEFIRRLQKLVKK